MKHEPITRARRRATNVTLPAPLIDQARDLDINLSKACEAGLAQAVRAEASRRWEEDHRGRIDAFTAWFEEHGMPFEDLRVF